MRVQALLLLVVATLLAGCAGSAPSTTAVAEEPLDGALAVPAQGTEPLDGAPLDPGAAPTWAVGDAWVVSSRGGSADERSVLVVTAADADSYTISTSSEQTAAFDAMFDISYVGAIRAEDLAGAQGGQPVKYFDFPLADGKTWTAAWDGYEVALTATKSATGFDIVGTVEGETYVEYDYTSELKWWSRLDFVRDGYGITIERHETEWSGTIATAAAKLLYEGAPGAPVASPSAGSFTMDEGQSFGVATLVGGGAQWARAFALVDPAGAPHMNEGIENFEAEGMGPRGVYLQERLPPTPGEWRIVAPAVHDASGGFFVTVHQVAVATAAFG